MLDIILIIHSIFYTMCGGGEINYKVNTLHTQILTVINTLQTNIILYYSITILEIEILQFHNIQISYISAYQ